MTKPPVEDYARAVWEIWSECRGRSTDMRSIEFHLIREWWVQGIPVRVVARAIEDCQGAKTAKSLQYLRPVVAEEATRWARSMSL